jgi:hypothetical protein
MASVIASIARAAAAFGRSAVSATASISSDLFTLAPYYFRLLIEKNFKLILYFVTNLNSN